MSEHTNFRVSINLNDFTEAELLENVLILLRAFTISTKLYHVIEGEDDKETETIKSSIADFSHSVLHIVLIVARSLINVTTQDNVSVVAAAAIKEAQDNLRSGGCRAFTPPEANKN